MIYHRTRERIFHFVSTGFICLVWFVNGFLCKVLNLVPRHQEIVSRILGEEYAAGFTRMIGIAEMLMVVWILSRIKSRFCALFQMSIVAIMNIVEFTVVPDLLLFGRFNSVLASLFIVLIYVNEFVMPDQRQYILRK
jgi:hypothetical protein